MPSPFGSRILSCGAFSVFHRLLDLLKHRIPFADIVLVALQIKIPLQLYICNIRPLFSNVSVSAIFFPSFFLLFSRRLTCTSLLISNQCTFRQ